MRDQLTRFRVIYHILGEDEDGVRKKARALCIEQTVEVPEAVVEGTWIGDNVVGRVERLTKASLEATYASPVWEVEISYPDDCVGTELTQFMNIIFGLSSILPGMQLVDVKLSGKLAAAFPGPRFGTDGLRKLLGVPKGPILATALKPLGKSTAEFAELAYKFAIGGIDIIKDDDGLSNQLFSPFEERVAACAAAVQKANKETGQKCLYAPCLNAPLDKLRDRAMFAKRAGAGAVLMLPGITSFDSMRMLAEDPEFGLPILCHPSLMATIGGSTTPGALHGFSHGMMYGTLPRLAGADVSIYLNVGGRFPLEPDECASITKKCRDTLGDTAPILPSPAGGMPLREEKVAEMLQVYGEDTMLLIGGGLYTLSPDIVGNCHRFMAMAGRIPSADLSDTSVSPASGAALSHAMSTAFHGA